MCGIVGVIAKSNVTPVLIEGLQRLECKGYDSTGIAILHNTKIKRIRRLGKMQELVKMLHNAPVSGYIGVSHTWPAFRKHCTSSYVQ